MSLSVTHGQIGVVMFPEPKIGSAIGSTNRNRRTDTGNKLIVPVGERVGEGYMKSLGLTDTPYLI